MNKGNDIKLFSVTEGYRNITSELLKMWCLFVHIFCILRIETSLKLVLVEKENILFNVFDSRAI